MLLQAAERVLHDTKLKRKHVIMMSDGIADGGVGRLYIVEDVSSLTKIFVKEIHAAIP